MAAKKKDFNTENIGRVYNTIADATAEEPAAIKAPAKEMPRRNRNTPPTADDIQEAREQGKTQGRKGCKAIRINMAFTPEVYDYIKIMSRVRGETITDFTNHVFSLFMQEHADSYEQAKDFIKSL